MDFKPLFLHIAFLRDKAIPGDWGINNKDEEVDNEIIQSQTLFIFQA